MSSHLTGSAPPTAGPRIPIVRVTSTEKQSFVIISDSVFGQKIHWYGNRSHECCEDSKHCEGCEKGWAQKWKGYLDCNLYHSTKAERCFLELTPRAYELIIAAAPKGKPLRGLMLDVAKTKGGAKGRYLIDVKERRIDPGELPQQMDPLPILRKLWLSKSQYVRDGE